MIRLLVWLLPTVIVAVPAVALGFFIVAVAGSPGPCDTRGRQVAATPQEAVSFQAKWDQLNAELEAGQASSATFTEGETTARARLWVDEHDVPVKDLLICFNAEGGSASAQVEVPVMPGNVDVLVEGTVILLSRQPEVEIERLAVGGLPSQVANLVDNIVTRIIDDQTNKITLDHRYAVTFVEGEMTITGTP